MDHLQAMVNTLNDVDSCGNRRHLTHKPWSTIDCNISVSFYEVILLNHTNVVLNFKPSEHMRMVRRVYILIWQS